MFVIYIYEYTHILLIYMFFNFTFYNVIKFQASLNIERYIHNIIDI